MSSWTPTKYKTRNWADYNFSLKQRGSLSIWFDPGMTWEAVWSKGASANLRRCCYSSLSDPQSLVRSALETDERVCGKPTEIGWAGLGVPNFSTLCRRQKALSVAIPYKGSAGPLHLLKDSTGIKAEGEGEWNARKHGGSKRRLWRKIHIGIDEETLEIRAIEVTSSSVGDAPMLPDLLNLDPPGSRPRERHC
jgi:hypothetical protein